MDRIKSICIEEELCQSHDGSLEQILKQMLSYKKLYNVILRAEKEPKYFEEHSYGKLYYDGEWHKVEFFAFVHADAYDNVLYNTSSNSRLEYLDYVKEHAKYLKKTSFDDNERYVTLSTCTSESTNGRHLLIGRILENTADEKGEPQYEEK